MLLINNYFIRYLNHLPLNLLEKWNNLNLSHSYLFMHIYFRNRINFSIYLEHYGEYHPS